MTGFFEEDEDPATISEIFQRGQKRQIQVPRPFRWRQGILQCRRCLKAGACPLSQVEDKAEMHAWSRHSDSPWFYILPPKPRRVADHDW